MKRKWLYGGKRAGYRLLILKKGDERFKVEVWYEGRIFRVDGFNTLEQAKDWARQRKNYYYGTIRNPIKMKTHPFSNTEP